MTQQLLILYLLCLTQQTFTIIGSLYGYVFNNFIQNLQSILQRKSNSSKNINFITTNTSSNASVNSMINAQNNKGQTPLLLACQQGHLDIAKLLLEAKADSNIVDYKNHSCLMFACLSGNLELVKFLFEKKITSTEDGYISDWHAEQLFRHACKSGNPEIVRYLSQRDDVHSSYFIHNASSDDKIVNFLLKHDDILESFFAKAFLNDYVPNSRDSYFFNGAIYCNHLELIKRYLELYDKYKEKWMNRPGTQERDFFVSLAGADDFSLSLYKSFPHKVFEIACKYGNLEVVELVLPKLGKIEDYNHELISKACENRHFHVAEFLMEHVNYINYKIPTFVYDDGREEEGWFRSAYVLFDACEKRKIDIIKFFMKHDSNNIVLGLHAWNEALLIARKKGFSDIVGLLEESILKRK